MKQKLGATLLIVALSGILLECVIIFADLIPGQNTGIGMLLQSMPGLTLFYRTTGSLELRKYLLPIGFFFGAITGVVGAFLGTKLHKYIS
jgi:hypothetical protein